ncbi:MAG TPA: type II secretion system protein [Candidatus Paceibacterota bacterium]|nr:type II secretion system protein [Candidatus Paceibacterota bacterium]
MDCTNRKKGFTLIELLVTIAIISLLSSIVLATLRTAKDKAKVAQTIAQVHQIETAFNLIYDKYGCWPLEATTSAACASTTIINPWIYTELYPTNVWSIRDYMTTKTSFPFDPTKEWAYSNNGTDETDCTSETDGVIIYVLDAPYTAYEKLETAIDETTEANLYSAQAKYCGHIQFEWANASGGNIYYQISRTTR